MIGVLIYLAIGAILAGIFLQLKTKEGTLLTDGMKGVHVFGLYVFIVLTWLLILLAWLIAIFVKE